MRIKNLILAVFVFLMLALAPGCDSPEPDEIVPPPYPQAPPDPADPSTPGELPPEPEAP